MAFKYTLECEDCGFEIRDSDFDPTEPCPNCIHCEVCGNNVPQHDYCYRPTVNGYSCSNCADRILVCEPCGVGYFESGDAAEQHTDCGKGDLFAAVLAQVKDLPKSEALATLSSAMVEVAVLAQVEDLPKSEALATLSSAMVEVAKTWKP